MADVRLVVTDMDGTLLNDQRQLPKDFASVVRQLGAKGIRWAIASGRQLANLQEQFAPLELALDFIAENGSLVQVANEAKPFFCDLTSAEHFQALLEVACRIPEAVPVLCGATGAWVYDGYPQHLPSVQHYFARTTLWHTLAEVMPCEVCKVAIYHPQAERVLLPKLLPFHSSALRVIHSSPYWVDVQATRIHKGHGLRALLDYVHLAPHQAVVFGDYLNDLEMMTMGTHSVAMANAHPTLAGACLHTTSSNNDNGVIAYLKTLGVLQ